MKNTITQRCKSTAARPQPLKVHYQHQRAGDHRQTPTTVQRTRVKAPRKYFSHHANLYVWKTMAVMSLERLMQASATDRAHFFIDWMASRRDKTHKTPIPESTCNDRDITNFAQLAVYYDKADILNLLINHNDTHYLTRQTNSQQFGLAHLAAR